MTDELRRAIAYMAARIVSGQESSAVHDFATGDFFNFSGDVSTAKIHVYDYERGCFLGGTPPSLYDFETGNFFDFKIEGDRVKGYDYESGGFYEATVNGKSVSLYDFDAGEFFNYSI